MMLRYLVAAFLGISLLGSATVRAEEPNRHEWSQEHENGAWHAYQHEHHMKAHEWEKASKKEQKAYWKWRDEHPGEFH
jgi:hypothetical protein